MADVEANPSGASIRRKLPDDFAARAVAMSDQDLRRHYVAGQSTIKRWRIESGATENLFKRLPNVQMPADFAEIANGMTVGQAADHFRRPRDTIRRWFGYAGIAPRPARFVATQKVNHVELDASVAGQAAQHLRRFYGSVHRADLRIRESGRATWGSERGLPDGGRGLYFVSGLGVMPDHEMVGLARDRGFKEWAA